MAPATMRRVCGSSALAAVIDSKLMPPWAIMSSWLVSVHNKDAEIRKLTRYLSNQHFYFIILLVAKKRRHDLTIHCQICNSTCCNSKYGLILCGLKQRKQRCKPPRFYNPPLICFCIKLNTC